MAFDDIFLVGPNQRTTRGDRPIHLAARSSSFQVLEFFKTLPEYSQMKESRNVEGHRPIDIVNEKEDTEVKSKLLGNGSLFVLLSSNSALSDALTCTIVFGIPGAHYDFGN